MGAEITRTRFPNRKAGTTEVSRGSKRKSSKEENVAVPSPSVPSLSHGRKSVAKKHAPPIKGTSGLTGL